MTLDIDVRGNKIVLKPHDFKLEQKIEELAFLSREVPKAFVNLNNISDDK